MKKRLFSLLLSLCLMLSLLPFGASAAEIVESGECNEGITWTLDSDGVLTVSGEGSIWWYAWLESERVKSEAKTAFFSEGITDLHVGGGAFFECTALTSVYFPASMTGRLIGGDFLMATALERIEVASDNPVQTSVDGVLYDKDLSTIIKCPAARSGVFSVPSSVKTIGTGAFANCDALTKIKIPASVTEIEEEPFDCAGLQSFEVASKNMNYTAVDGVLLSKDLSELIAYPYGKAANCTIPDGVKTIGSCAFRRDENLESVVIPEGVESIGNSAFAECNSLHSVTIPASMTHIWYHAFSCGRNAFDAVQFTGTTEQWDAIQIEEGNDALTNSMIQCTDGVVDPNAVKPANGQCGENVFWSLDAQGVLTISGTGDMTDYDWQNHSPFYDNPSVHSVVIEPGVTSIGSSAFTFMDYRKSSNLSEISIPDTVTRIGDFAFCGCTALTSVQLPNRLKSIGYHAFVRCSSLQSITIPASVRSLGVGVFVDCHEMTAINVAANNKYYESLDGVLFNKGRTRLLEYPAAKEGDYRIPSGVTVIEEDAFTDLSGLTGVVIPEGVTELKTGAFIGCWNMTRVTIPGSVTRIGERAFAYDRSLASVYYYGTQKQWDAIQIEDNNDELLNAAIHYFGVNPIVTQPQDVTCYVGQTAVISFTTKGTGLKYQWQWSRDGENWTDSTGSKTAKLSFTAKASFSGRMYRCVVTKANGNEYISDAAILTVEPGPKITAQPQNTSVLDGKKAAFSVSAEGDGLTWQWQYSADSGKTWKDSTAASASTAKLSITARASFNGRLYRCVITDTYGNQTITDAAKLTVWSSPTITAQPENAGAAPDKRATFSVTAVGEGLTYQWQYSANNGKTWKDSTSASASTAKLSITARASFTGRLYRCVVTDANGKTAVSDAAKLIVAEGPIVVTQPQDAAVSAEQKAVFSVKAVGDGLTYQWQYSSNSGTTWKNSTAASAVKATLIVTTKASFDGRLYRCIVTDAEGRSVTSEAARLTISK